MKNLKQHVINFWKDEEGLTTVEYAIAGSLVGLGVVGAFTALGDKVDAAIDAITSKIATTDTNA
ncbi:Flp family type IVb pilin [Photobacterium sp. MCCC 1A19761]|uniref:Flp family type IVb pilin n=1 Tax=Photobacterium sp. MCCC 1A19761 TaxID=3115000 RepID=UPI00307F59B6